MDTQTVEPVADDTIEDSQNFCENAMTRSSTSIEFHLDESTGANAMIERKNSKTREFQKTAKSNLLCLLEPGVIVIEMRLGDVDKITPYMPELTQALDELHRLRRGGRGDALGVLAYEGKPLIGRNVRTMLSEDRVVFAEETGDTLRERMVNFASKFSQGVAKQKSNFDRYVSSVTRPRPPIPRHNP